MTVQQTSLEAYIEMRPRLGEQQDIIFKTISVAPGISNHELSRCLDMEINCVTPRVLELREIGLVKEAGLKVDDRTGKAVMGWTKT